MLEPERHLLAHMRAGNFQTARVKMSGEIVRPMKGKQYACPTVSFFITTSVCVLTSAYNF
jgi:hypothetical protein